jgi:formyltetrahydrofolate deformylase
VISNHNDLRSMVEWHGIPFFHVPVDPKDKAPAFAEVSRLVRSTPPTWWCWRATCRSCRRNCAGICEKVINIHHSFLPSFVGAKPYHQAALRGVKLIGATCHYVTEELDAGPIIEQDVVRVSHSDSIEDMVRLAVTSRRWCWPVACVITWKTACWCTATRPWCLTETAGCLWILAAKRPQKS